MSKYFVYCDGGARGNPGPAGYGFVIKSKGKRASSNLQTIVEGSGFLGTMTNNQAEYTAVLKALQKIHSLTRQTARCPEIDVFLDSKLIVEQMNGRYKIKNKGLKPFYWKIRDLMMELGGKIVFSYIPREKNKEADRLVNLAINEKLKTKNKKPKI